VNIRLLIAELSTIKSALTQIHDWAAYNLTEKQEQRVGDSLETTLDGCGLAMGILAEDVAEILRIDILGHNEVRNLYWSRYFVTMKTTVLTMAVR
jgi:hypothetical protein